MGGPPEKGTELPSSDTIRGVRTGGKRTAQHHIVYLSPNGSTRSVAEALAQGLSEDEASVALTDLARPELNSGAEPDSMASAVTDDASQGTEPDCLFIGSPVYFNRTVPPVMAFIEGLPPSNGSWAVPFVTYGKACSGLALWQMGSALRDKGYRIAGALKVQSIHSLMWEAEDPVGAGHPDEEELGLARDFAEALNRGFHEGAPRELELHVLDYHPEELTAELRSKLSKPPPIMPKAVDGQVCTECGTCADECPVQTITLNPLPEFGDDCIDCFNCVRLCPEEAIVPESSLAEIGEMVRRRAHTVDETPLTLALLPPSS